MYPAFVHHSKLLLEIMIRYQLRLDHPSFGCEIEVGLKKITKITIKILMREIFWAKSCALFFHTFNYKLRSDMTDKNSYHTDCSDSLPASFDCHFSNFKLRTTFLFQIRQKYQKHAFTSWSWQQIRNYCQN